MALSVISIKEGFQWHLGMNSQLYQQRGFWRAEKGFHPCTDFKHAFLRNLSSEDILLVFVEYLSTKTIHHMAGCSEVRLTSLSHIRDPGVLTNGEVHPRFRSRGTETQVLRA